MLNVPYGWKKISLGTIGDVAMCKRILKQQTNNIKGVPFYKIGTFGVVADAYIDNELFQHYKTKYPYPNVGDVLISAAGTIGRLVVFNGEEAYFQDSNIVWLQNDEKIVLNRYLYYLYQTIKWQTSEGGIVSRLYNNAIRQTVITLPPIEEQKKIAGILGTWDRAIEELTELITEKKELRKGLANRLLNGLMWQDVELSDLLNYEQPTKYLVTEILDYDAQKTPVLTANKAFILGSTDDTTGVYSKQDCIIFDDFTTDMKYVDFSFKVKSSAIKILTPRENVNLKFVFEQMLRLKLPMGGHKRHWVSEYQYLTVKMPDENLQNKIVFILSKADSEINLLNQWLAVLKEQKRGLMQKLLTGEIRVKVDDK